MISFPGEGPRGSEASLGFGGLPFLFYNGLEIHFSKHPGRSRFDLEVDPVHPGAGVSGSVSFTGSIY